MEFYMKRSIAFALLTLLFAFPSTLLAEESFEDLIKSAQEAKSQGKYGKAIADLGWASKQLEAAHSKKIAGFLPSDVGEFKGSEVETSGAIGMLSIEKHYKAASGASIKLSITGSAGGEGGGGLGGFAGMAQMAAMMGGGPGVETVRVKGHRATIDNSSGEPRLMLNVAGFVVQVEPADGAVTKEQLVAVAEAIDIKGFEAYSAE
jgi:hypothetical protein